MDNSIRFNSRKTKSFGKKKIDVNAVLKALLRKLWLIILVAVICGGMAYAGAKLFIPPTYRAVFTAYINNQKGSDLSGLTGSDVAAAQALAHTYSEIITSRSVLESAAEASGHNYGYNQLKDAVTTTIGSETEIVSVSVEAKTPEDAYDLAREIATSAVKYATTIVEGSTMKIIDLPEVPTGIYKPSYIQIALLGALVGAFVTSVIICLVQIFNDKIRNVAELQNRYTIPIVGTIPDMIAAEKLSKKAGYGYYGHSSGKGDSKESKK